MYADMWPRLGTSYLLTLNLARTHPGHVVSGMPLTNWSRGIENR